MKYIKRLTLLSTAFLLFGFQTGAEEMDLVDKAMAACKTEVDSYCSEVTLGEGRMLACLYAHGDKVSGACELGVYRAAAELEQFVAGLHYVASRCVDDLLEHCGEVEIGELRVAECLLQHQDDLDDSCRAAVEETGMRTDN